MMDYMLPKKVMSWQEAFELYFEQQMLDGLFPDLEFYGIRPPRHLDQAIAEKGRLSHEVYWTLYSFGFGTSFTTTVPTAEELDWMSASYPDTFDRIYRPRWERARRMTEDGKRFFFPGLPMLCQVCQIPTLFTEASDPTTLSTRRGEFRGERFNFCSDGCKWIFEREPEKYVQAWLPVHQVLQGNCGGPTVPEVLAWCGLQEGDSGEYLTSSDKASWDKWHAPAAVGGAR